MLDPTKLFCLIELQYWALIVVLEILVWARMTFSFRSALLTVSTGSPKHSAASSHDFFRSAAFLSEL